jgi:2-isopropylmalate synthase
MSQVSREDLIYDWNEVERGSRPTHAVKLDDETLRDGLQSPSVRDPDIAAKLEILHAMAKVGIHSLDLGLPGAGPRAQKDVLALAREIVREKLPLGAYCAARTVRADIEPVLEVVQKTGLRIQVAMFIGSSHIRQYVEEWDLSRILRHSEDAMRFCNEHDLGIMYVTEDTTRTHPEITERLYRHAIEMGAERLVIADTVGHATPSGARALVTFVKGIVEASGRDVEIDWHGHRDRGLAVPNAIAAYEAGAHRLHGCALGIGERSGNCAMELLLVNLKLMGYLDNDLSALNDYCQAVSRHLEVPIPKNCPVVGSDAFETATGVHAAAVVKAMKKGDAWLVNSIYSGVPADMVGLEQRITVGPMSGKWNVIHWLQSRGLPVEDETVAALFEMAKRSDRVLDDAELMREVQRVTTAP